MGNQEFAIFINLLNYAGFAFNEKDSSRAPHGILVNVRISDQVSESEIWSDSDWFLTMLSIAAGKQSGTVDILAVMPDLIWIWNDTVLVRYTVSYSMIIVTY